MKVFLCFFLLFSGYLVNAQENPSTFGFEGGIVAGLNISTVQRSLAVTFTSIGISSGLKGLLTHKSKLQLHGHLLYSQKGYQVDATLQTPVSIIDPNDVYTWDYIDFPILVGYEFTYQHFSFAPIIGMQQGWMLRAYHFDNQYQAGNIISNGTNLLEDPTVSINQYEIGWVAGISFKSPSIGRVTPFLDFRYTHATNKISTSADQALSVSNRMLSFNGGIYF